MYKKQQPREQNRQPKKFNKGPVKQQKQTEQKPMNKKAHANQGEQLPTIQNMLEINQEDRPTKTAEYFKKVKTFLHSYKQKKIGSRVIQLMFLWGSDQIKNQIFKCIVQNWKELIKSKYALHTISKVSVSFEFPKIVEDAVLLQNNKEGSMVLEHYINKHQGYPNAQAIFKKFEAIEQGSTEKGFESQQVLHNLAMKSIQKEYFSNKISKLIIKLAVPTMVAEEQQKVIQFFAQKALDLLNDEEGVKLFVTLYNYFDSKQKKNIVKLLKGRVNDLVSLSKMSYVGLIKILTETDDTISIGNKIIPEIVEHISEITNNNSKVYPVLISLLSARNNNFNCLGKIERTVPFTTCKKPEETRFKQIRSFVYDPLSAYLTSEQNIDNTCKQPNESRLALGMIKSMQTDGSDVLKTFTVKILDHFLADLQKNKIANSKKHNIKSSLAAQNFGSKLLKNILLLKEQHIDKYCDKFAQIFKINLEQTLHSNASFVLTVLIDKGRKQLIDQIKKSKIDVSKARASDFYTALIKGNKK